MKLTKEKRETLERNLKGWEDMAQTGRPFLKPNKPLGDDCEDIDRFVCGPEFSEERKWYASQMIRRIKKLLGKEKPTSKPKH